MPQPTAAQLHVDTLLTNVLIGYTNLAYIADQMLPQVPVMKQSDLIPKYDQSPMFRDDARIRAPGTKSHGGGFTVDTTQNYFCPRYSRRYEIYDEVRQNTDEPFNLDDTAAKFIADKMFMRREVDFAVNQFKTGVWGTDLSAPGDFTKWSDFGASTPVDDVDDFKDRVELKVGREPNKVAISKGVWLKGLKNHPTLMDRIKYTQRAQLSVDLAASLLEIESLLVGRAIRTTDPEGTAEASVTYTRIWGDNMLLLWVPPSASILTPAAGYTFVWQVIQAALQYIKRMRDEERETDIIEGNTYYTHVVTSKNSGLFASSLI